MRIEHAEIQMDSSREYCSDSTLEFTSEYSFRNVFAQVTETSAAAMVDTQDQQARLVALIEKLLARLLAFITEGSESANSDLRDVLHTERVEPGPRGPEAARQQIEMRWKNVQHERFSEQEKTCFSSSGQIRTADGRALDFTLECQMRREFSCERTWSESGKVVLRDPLVINFSGQAADLSGQRMHFDLDADGHSESLPGLGACSGYLAIDRNADGCINDGSELFGTRSGNGFADLATFDSDGNRWLDESDPAFASLQVWRQNAAGEKTLGSLRVAGVGALYLGSTATPFALTDSENRVLGQIRASGIYLTERGEVGSLQQIDLALHKTTASG